MSINVPIQIRSIITFPFHLQQGWNNLELIYNRQIQSLKPLSVVSCSSARLWSAMAVNWLVVICWSLLNADLGKSVHVFALSIGCGWTPSYSPLSSLSYLLGSVTRQHRSWSLSLPAAFIKLSSVSDCSSLPAAWCWFTRAVGMWGGWKIWI